MIRQVLALGPVGARMAEALIYQCMAGLPAWDAVSITLMGAPSADGERLRTLMRSYTPVQQAVGNGTGPFSTRLTLTVWPEETATQSLEEQASADPDRLLCRALFTPQQASLSPAHAMDQSGSVAAVTWASCLENTDDPALRRILTELDSEGRFPCVLLSGLTDPSGASGVITLASWLKRNAGVKPAAVLMLPVHRTEETGLAREALLSGRMEELLAGAALIGMPEDCRRSTGGAHICDWFSALACISLLSGKDGVMTWSIPAGNLSWQAFGDNAQQIRASYDALARMSAMLAGVYSVTLEHALAEPSWLRDRVNGWYHTHFGDVRRLSEDDRLRLAYEAKCLRLSLNSCMNWLSRMLDALPPILQWADELKAASDTAREGYEPVLETAGRLAWLLDEAEQSGMAEERFVHRYDMSDSEAEATMKQIDAMRDRLSSQMAEQEARFRIIGGRMTRSILQQVLKEEQDKADDLRAQSKEAARRIARAAEIASPEDQPKVATARARLMRMERQVVLLSGRATRARRDLASWDRDDRRALVPTLDLSGAESVPILYPLEWLKALSCLTAPDDRSASQSLKVLMDSWPWPQLPPRAIADKTAEASPAAAADQVGAFIKVLWRSCRS